MRTYRVLTFKCDVCGQLSHWDKPRKISDTLHLRRSSAYMRKCGWEISRKREVCDKCRETQTLKGE